MRSSFPTFCFIFSFRRLIFFPPLSLSLFFPVPSYLFVGGSLSPDVLPKRGSTGLFPWSCGRCRLRDRGPSGRGGGCGGAGEARAALMTNTLGHAAGPPCRIPAAAAPWAATVRSSGGRGTRSEMRRVRARSSPASRVRTSALASFTRSLPPPFVFHHLGSPPPHPAADSPDGTRAAPTSPSSSPRAPSFLHVSAEREMLNSGRTGTWSPSSFHSALAKEPPPPRWTA